MSPKQTTVSERNQMIDLKLEGYSLQAIADQSGWSFGCVRRWWRRYREGGRAALDPADGRSQRGGRMSTFPRAVRQAFQAIKADHPGWGAPLARLTVAQQLEIAAAQLPTYSTIEKYWAERCPELLHPRRRHPAPPATDRPTDISLPHQRWQLDFKESMPVPSYGRVDVLNIRDEATPVKIASQVFPTRQSTGRDVQQVLRAAFAQWGLCDRLQSDHDKRLYNPNHDYPFPTVMGLWLAGLGIAHDLAPSAQANGAVERFNRTWYEHVLWGSDFATLAEIQSASDHFLRVSNQQLPSRGGGCHGQPPLTAYPQALQPRRRYSRAQEAELFDMQGVYDYLASQEWWRRVSAGGQVSLGGKRYQVGMAYAEQEVRITCHATQHNFPVFASDGKHLTDLTLDKLNPTYIIG